jgi:hypothetical protein
MNRRQCTKFSRWLTQVLGEGTITRLGRTTGFTQRLREVSPHRMAIALLASLSCYSSCLTAAHVDCCTLANNHALDWGRPGLAETIDTLTQAGVKTAGAGRNRNEAKAPAILPVPGKGRIVVFSLGR